MDFGSEQENLDKFVELSKINKNSIKKYVEIYNLMLKLRV